jgi:iron complex transport system substrate-binding protein
MDITKLGGWTNELSASEKAYIPDEYEDLPMLGGWSSANPTANIEELVNADIDVILVTAIVSQKVIDTADNIQSQTGIPTVIVSSDLNSLGEAYTLLGTLFEEAERGQELSDYCVESLAETKAMIDQVPDDEKVRVFYSEGTNGMETDPSGSMHTQAFDFVGAVNVADISENTANGLVGQSEVSLEQIIAWNPQFIIRNSTYTEADPTAAVDEIMDNSDWANIKAVQDGNVYQTPALPNNWIDRAPSVNRVLGVKWLADLFYPDYVDYDIHEEAKEFFSLFYNLDLSDEDLNTILGE